MSSAITSPAPRSPYVRQLPMVEQPIELHPLPAPRQGGFDGYAIVRVLLRWRWLILGGAVGGLLVAMLVSALITPIYRARAVIEINNEPVQVMDMGNVQPVQMNDGRYFDTQIGLLRSDSLAERVARSLKLDGNNKLAGDAPAKDRLRAVSRQLGESFTVAPKRSSRLVELYFDSSDAAFAGRAVNAFADSFIQSSLERRFAATAYARNFLQQRIAAMKAKLERSERDLVMYAQQQGIVNVQSSGDKGGETSLSASALLTLSQMLAQAQGERMAAQEKYRQAVGSVSAEALSNPTVQQLTTQLAQTRADYQDKLGLYRPDHPTMSRLRERMADLERSVGQQNGLINNSLLAAYRAAQGRESELRAQIAMTKRDELNLRGRSIQYNIFQREVDTNRSLYDGLLQRYKEIGVAGGVGDSLISIIDRAKTPGSPITPNWLLNIAIGLGAGLALGAGTAFGLDYLSNTINKPEDVKGKLGLTLIGVVPMFARDRKIEELLRDRRSHVYEAYSSARTALQFSTSNGAPRSLLITSASQAEGKTSSAVALARGFATLGLRTLLVDGDLRRPSLRGVDEDCPGFAHLLTGTATIADCVQETSVSMLHLLTAGMVPPDPVELLGTPRASETLRELEAQFDMVVIDGPPVLGLADAPLLGSICEGTLIVLEAGEVRASAVQTAIHRLKSARAHVVGCLLTKFKAQHAGYGYGYGYGYGFGYGYDTGTRAINEVDIDKLGDGRDERKEIA